MFTVRKRRRTVARLRANGAELVGGMGPVRGQVQTLLHAEPRGHHRRAAEELF